MATVQRKGMFTRDFALLDGARVIASFEFPGLTERAEIRIGSALYEAKRKGWLANSFAMELSGAEKATAESEGFFQRTYEVRFGASVYQLKRDGWFSTDFLLMDGERQVGTLVRTGFFRTNVETTFSDDVDPALQAFIVWVTNVLWRQAAAAAAG